MSKENKNLSQFGLLLLIILLIIIGNIIENIIV